MKIQTVRLLVVASALGLSAGAFGAQPPASAPAAAVTSGATSHSAGKPAAAPSAASSSRADPRVFTPSTPISNAGDPSSIEAPTSPPGIPLSLAGAAGSHKPKAFRRLPIVGMTIMESTDGHVYLVSADGRLMIMGGKWIDVWSGTEIRSIEDSKSLDTIDLARMGVNPDDFFTITIGTGPKKVTAFIDPQCPECRVMLNQAKALGGQYTFKFIVSGFMGKESIAIARKMVCANDKALATAALFSGSFTALPAVRPDCTSNVLEKAFIVSQILGVRTLPFFVRPDGSRLTGKITDLATALQQTTNK